MTTAPGTGTKLLQLDIYK